MNRSELIEQVKAIIEEPEIETTEAIANRIIDLVQKDTNSHRLYDTHPVTLFNNNHFIINDDQMKYVERPGEIKLFHTDYTLYNSFLNREDEYNYLKKSLSMKLIELIHNDNMVLFTKYENYNQNSETIQASIAVVDPESICRS